MEEHDSRGVPCQVEGSGPEVSMVTFGVRVADGGEGLGHAYRSILQFFGEIHSVVSGDDLLEFSEPVVTFE